MSKIIISIVICTHNRADLLHGAIRSVLEQKISNKNYELIVVDNNSSDSTRAVVEEFSSQYAHVSYIMETNTGLSHARNRGWQEAQGEYIGYLDDDAKASPGWLSAAHDVAKNIRPEAFGGPYYAFYNSPKPVWFKDIYGSSVLGEVARPLRKDEYVSGGNMFIRRDILSQLEGFYPNLGMKGKKKGYGEETNFFIRLRSTMKDSIVYYDPKVFIYHLVRPEKFGLYHIVSASFIRGRQYYNAQGGDNSPRVLLTILIILGTILGTIKSLTWNILRRDRQAYSFPQNYIYECTTMLIFWLGYQIERLRTCKELF